MRIDWGSFRKKYTRPEKGLFPVGSRVYIGRQGRGKTLSMVYYVLQLQEAYPKSVVFSNVKLHGIKYKFLKDDDDVAMALKYENGQDGVLVLLDEAHLFFNSKSGIPVEVLTAISQQRKDRRRIVFTSQIWNELDISIRKQVQDVVACSNIGRFQWNKFYDGESITIDKSDYTYRMDKIRPGSEIFKHNDELYEKYNTLQKIIRNESYDRSSQAAAPLVAVQAAQKNASMFGKRK